MTLGLVVVALVGRGSNPNAKITSLRDWSPELLEAKKVNQRAMSVEEKDGKPLACETD